MPRYSDSARIDAGNARRLLVVDFVRIAFGCTDNAYSDQATCELNGEIWTDDLLMCTMPRDMTVTVDSGQGPEVKTFIAGSELLKLPDIEENLEMVVSKVTITIAAITNQWLIKSQSIELANRPVWIWRQYLDPDTQATIGDPFLIFGGKIVDGNLLAIEQGDGSVVSLEASNQFYDLKRVAGFRCNVEDHQAFFPNDTGFKFTSSIKKELKWM